MKRLVSGLFLSVLGLLWLVPFLTGHIQPKPGLPGGGQWIVAVVGSSLFLVGQWLLWICRWFPYHNPLAVGGGVLFLVMGLLLSILAFTVEEGVDRWPLFLCVGVPFLAGGLYALLSSRHHAG